MLLILIIILIALQVGAYKLTNKMKMNYNYLKVLIAFLVFNQKNSSRLCLGVKEEKFEKRMVFHQTKNKIISN